MPLFLETIMLLCFGLSWPMSILRSRRAGTAKGKSLFFLCAIELGYTTGILAKVLGGNVSYVLAFYILNWVMVAIDIALYIRNRKRDKEAA